LVVEVFPGLLEASEGAASENAVHDRWLTLSLAFKDIAFLGPQQPGEYANDGFFFKAGIPTPRSS
jgi:hypothetical protein